MILLFPKVCFRQMLVLNS